MTLFLRYDPEAITTKDGYLEITLSEKETHNLNYQGGMLSTWNKFCFTTGYVEVSIVLPGHADSSGYVSVLSLRVTAKFAYPRGFFLVAWYLGNG